MEDALAKFKDVIKKMYDQGSSASGGADLDALISDGLVCLIKIKQDSHNLCLETEALRTKTGERKAELDQRNLQLQNLLYEKLYYEKEIRTCRSFQSAFTDEQIGLMGSEEFKASAPPEFLQDCEGDGHRTRMQQLCHELFLRKEMVKKKEEIEHRKKKLLEELKRQKSRVDSVKNQLAAVADASKPLQDSLASAQVPRQLGKLAELLPLPLYLIFAQISSHQELLSGDVRVSIQGSEEDAESYKHSNTACSSVMDVDDNSLAKRARVEASGAGSGISPTSVHPLTVQLQFTTAGQNLLINFQHVHPLNIVLAACANPAHNDILANMFPGDLGDVDVFGGCQPQGLCQGAKPYRWAQHLAGLDLVPVLPSWASMSPEQQGTTLNSLATCKSQLRVQALMDVLSLSAQASAALKLLLDELRLKRFPKAEYSGKKPVATLIHWSQLSQDKAAKRQIVLPGGSSGVTPNTTPPPSPLPAAAETLTPAAAEEEEEGMILDEGELMKATPPPLTPPLSAGELPCTADELWESDMTTTDEASRVTTTTSEQPDSLQQQLGPEAERSVLQQLLQPPTNSSRIFPAAKFSFKIRQSPVEVDGVVSIYHLYPSHPPRLKVTAIHKVSLEKRERTFHVVKSTVVTPTYVNAVDLIEQQFNVEVLSVIPPGEMNRVLAYQLDQLRRCVEELSVTVRYDGPTITEHWRKLASRQQVSGRARLCLFSPMA